MVLVIAIMLVGKTFSKKDYSYLEKVQGHWKGTGKWENDSHIYITQNEIVIFDSDVSDIEFMEYSVLEYRTYNKVLCFGDDRVTYSYIFLKEDGKKAIFYYDENEYDIAFVEKVMSKNVKTKLYLQKSKDNMEKIADAIEMYMDDNRGEMPDEYLPAKNGGFLMQTGYLKRGIVDPISKKDYEYVKKYKAFSIHCPNPMEYGLTDFYYDSGEGEFTEK